MRWKWPNLSMTVVINRVKLLVFQYAIFSKLEPPQKVMFGFGIHIEVLFITQNPCKDNCRSIPPRKSVYEMYSRSSQNMSTTALNGMKQLALPKHEIYLVCLINRINGWIVRRGFVCVCECECAYKWNQQDTFKWAVLEKKNHDQIFQPLLVPSWSDNNGLLCLLAYHPESQGAPFDVKCRAPWV